MPKTRRKQTLSRALDARQLPLFVGIETPRPVKKASPPAWLAGYQAHQAQKRSKRGPK